MRVLLMAGLGPYEMGSKALDGTLFARGENTQVQDSYRRLVGHPLDLGRLWHGKPPHTNGQGPEGHDAAGG